MKGDVERRVDAAVAAAQERGRSDAGSAGRARAVLRRLRSHRRIWANRDSNAGCDLGGEAAEYTVEAFCP